MCFNVYFVVRSVGLVRDGERGVSVLLHQGFASVYVCVAGCCSMLQCVAVCCSVLQCVVVCCSALQCVAVCCSVLQCGALWFKST